MPFETHEQNGLVWFTASNLGGVRHGFSTRLGGVSPAPWDSLNLGATLGDDPVNVRWNFNRFCSVIGTDEEALVKNHQIHSSIIRPVTRDDILPDPAQPGTCEADGLITDQPEVCLTIFSGDCIPVLLYDPVRRCIAAAHAGWRGTAAGIATTAVERMRDVYGCDPADILAAVGPGIGPDCFETHEDVPNAMTAALSTAVLRHITIKENGKFAVDLKAINAMRLEGAGLDPEHIAVSSLCTSCHPEMFWSHRKLGTSRGSMAAAIQLL